MTIRHAFFVCLATIGAAGHAQDATLKTEAGLPTATAAPMVTPTAAPVGGKIVMYRPASIMGMALGCPIRFREREVVELGRGKFAEWVVPAGHYILTNKTSSVDVIVDAGGTSYVRCVIKPGFMTGRADLQIVDQETFAEHQKDFEKKNAEFTYAQ